MTQCKTCQLSKARSRGSAPLWDNIHRTKYWDVVHSFDVALPGWLVLVLRRHTESVADLTEAEAAELGPLQRSVSRALVEVTGCAKTYVVQFAEHPQHPHVHFHIIPRMADMPDEFQGPGVFGYKSDVEGERVSDEEMNRIAAQVRAKLSNMAM